MRSEREQSKAKPKKRSLMSVFAGTISVKSNEKCETISHLAAMCPHSLRVCAPHSGRNEAHTTASFRPHRAHKHTQTHISEKSRSEFNWHRWISLHCLLFRFDFDAWVIRFSFSVPSFFISIRSLYNLANKLTKAVSYQLWLKLGDAYEIPRGLRSWLFSAVIDIDLQPNVLFRMFEFIRMFANEWQMFKWTTHCTISVLTNESPKLSKRSPSETDEIVSHLSYTNMAQL